MKLDGIQNVGVNCNMNAALVEGCFEDVSKLVAAFGTMGFRAVEVIHEDEISAMMDALDNDAMKRISKANTDISTVVLQIDGMMCQGSCARDVQRSLQTIPGVKSAIVSFVASAAIIEGSECVEKLIDCVKSVGFSASEVVDMRHLDELISEMESLNIYDAGHSSLEIEASSLLDADLDMSYHEDNDIKIMVNGPRIVKISIFGMTCASCMNHIERRISKMDGVIKISVALIAEEAYVEYDADVLCSSDIREAIQNLGYQAKILEELSANTASKRGIGKLKFSIFQSFREDHLEDTLLGIDGVLEFAMVDDIVTLIHDTNTIGARDLFSRLQKLGIACMLVRNDYGSDGFEKNVSRNDWFLFYGSMCFTIPIVAITMVAPHISNIQNALLMPTGLGMEWYSLLLFLLCTPVQFFFCSAFLQKRVESFAPT